MLGGQPEFPSLGVTLLAPGIRSGVTRQNLRRGAAWQIWVGCGALVLPGRLGTAWRGTKALPTGRWSLWRCPQPLSSSFTAFYFVFLLCATEREPFRRACSQTLKPRAARWRHNSSADASESGLCSSFLCCSLIKPLTSTARGPSISCLPKEQHSRDGWDVSGNLPAGLGIWGV